MPITPVNETSHKQQIKLYGPQRDGTTVLQGIVDVNLPNFIYYTTLNIYILSLNVDSTLLDFIT